MNRRHLVSILASVPLALFSANPLHATKEGGDDTDLRMVDAQVVEVADGHLSIIAQTGVEHVIAVDGTKTKVMIKGQLVSLKDVREGDVITIELDEQNPVMFARAISINTERAQVARVRR
jgi:hypothetical protein